MPLPPVGNARPSQRRAPTTRHGGSRPSRRLGDTPTRFLAICPPAHLSARAPVRPSDHPPSRPPVVPAWPPANSTAGTAVVRCLTFRPVLEGSSRWPRAPTPAPSSVPTPPAMPPGPRPATRAPCVLRVVTKGRAGWAVARAAPTATKVLYTGSPALSVVRSPLSCTGSCYTVWRPPRFPPANHHTCGGDVRLRAPRTSFWPFFTLSPSTAASRHCGAAHRVSP